MHAKLVCNSLASASHSTYTLVGIIVNVGSEGGFAARPAVGIYAASKFAVEGITDALRGEVSGLGITVIVVEPGMAIM